MNSFSAIERPVELHKIQKGDIWLQYSHSLLGFLIRVAIQSPVNHAGQIIENGYIIHALRNGLVKEKYNSYINNPKLRITILRVKDSLFNSPEEREEIINSILAKAQGMYTKGLGYSHKLLLLMGWRATLRLLGLRRIKKVKNFLDQRRVEIICSQFVDDVWDELEKRKGIDLFRTTIHPKEVTPKDILKSSHVSYVTGWYYPEYFDKPRSPC